jgi:hypothetical protein
LCTQFTFFDPKFNSIIQIRRQGLVFSYIFQFILWINLLWSYPYSIVYKKKKKSNKNDKTKTFKESSHSSDDDDAEDDDYLDDGDDAGSAQEMQQSTTSTGSQLQSSGGTLPIRSSATANTARSVQIFFLLILQRISY